jgi:cbb3-type cytochrome oxidase subunit 3
MYREFYAALPSTLLPIVVMAFFLVLFVVVVLRTFALKGRRDYDRVAALPLADDPHSDSDTAAAVPHEVTR